ncbi:hypothetical protein HMPREF3205_01576 [Streptococcus pasteurianus]|nr:hypothetical protein HMPREF3205_01576 [Streptococcus pasteurianus]
MSYHHFTIDERESILSYRTQGITFSQRMATSFKTRQLFT